ncbi:DUF760 domain-containing protein [Planktothrix sp. FACHB-1365]|uniref:DUF760 domain-containing protein n=1 Tax=Planktothrix sp. FACHB-1365 TaxID=2692855 RepID=UPI0016869E5F|nr:DUF760 domain-containing protein [Planktothrix sp. FACHB-1365]MBD2484308.1 DUF760 domain-containing protein [Planktothrix sp. FACHB-1365]
MTNPVSHRQLSANNVLWQYVQAMEPETIAKLSQPEPEVAQIMENSLMQMLGGLPSEHFDVTITTNREDLGRLLASAMMNGYFLYNAKQRLEFEKSLSPSQEA